MGTESGAEASEKQVQKLEKQVRQLEGQVLKLSEDLDQRDKILDHLPDHVLIQDRNHRIHWANQTACQSLKRSREAVLGRKCHEIWNARSEPCPDCPASRCLETGKWESVERSTPDGRTWRIRCFPLCCADAQNPVILEVAEDISETVKSREGQRQAEQHRALILDTMGEMLAYLDTELRVQWANRAAAASVGAEVPDLVGRYCYAIWQGRDRPCEDCPVIEAMKTGQPREGEGSTPDGRLYRIRGYPVYDEKGALIGAVEYGFDITDAKAAENALKASEEKFRKFFDTDVVAMAISRRRDGMYLEVNPGFEKVTGYSHEEIVGHTSPELGFFTPAQRAVLVAELSEKGRLENQELSFPTKNAGLKTILFSIGPITINHEDCFLATMVDITERKRMEQALNESEAKFRLIFQNAGYGIATADEKGNLTDANPMFCRMLGYSRQELLGKNFSDFTLPQYHAYEFEQVEKIYQGKISGYSFEKQYQTKGGEAIWGYLSVTANRNNQGDIIGFIGTVTDITDRKQAEKQLRQVQKAESLGRMAGAVAHHFNNTLMAVMGHLELAQSDLPEDMDAFQNLVQARAAADRACQMSQLMRTYLGHQPAKSSPLDLSETCMGYLETLRSEIPAGVGLQKVLPLPGPVIHADPEQIRTVIKALVTNAWEAMRKNHPARIKVSTGTARALEIQEDRRFQADWKPTARQYAALTVSDTGKGIPPESMEKLFDPFFTDKFTGRGLGLAVALGIVKAHGGCITVKSTPGAGSCFTVFLPLSGETV